MGSNYEAIIVKSTGHEINFLERWDSGGGQGLGGSLGRAYKRFYAWSEQKKGSPAKATPKVQYSSGNKKVVTLRSASTIRGHPQAESEERT